MFNLVAHDHVHSQLGLGADFGAVAWACADQEAGRLYVCSDALHVAAFPLEGGAEPAWALDVRAACAAAGAAPPPPGARAAAFARAPELAALSLALDSGELLLVRPPAARGAAPTLEDVGLIEGGVAAAAWAPGGAALALVGGAGQLLLMSSGWELLSERPAAGAEPEFPQPTAPPPAPLPPGAAPPRLGPSDAAISWRGDGRYFATATRDDFGSDFSSAVDGAAAELRVRVWDAASGALHALGEPAPGLAPALAWQPNCRHLFAAQAVGGGDDEAGEGLEGLEEGGAGLEGALEGDASGARGAQGQAPTVRHVGAWKRELRRCAAAAAAAAAAGAPRPAGRALLFERNGLRHGEFELPALGGGAAAVEALAWSPDSELLAVVLASSDASAARDSNAAAGAAESALPSARTSFSGRALQLWRRSNWHWYLKLERRFPGAAGLTVAWEEHGALGAAGAGLGPAAVGGAALHAVTAEGAHSRTAFVSAPCASALGTAAVVDGARVLLTPLRLGLVPPPLAAAALALPAPAAALALRDAGAGYEDAASGGGGDAPAPWDCARGGEAVAAALADGRLAVLEAVEGDLWAETAEEQGGAAPAGAAEAPARLAPAAALRAPAGAPAGAAPRLAAWASRDSLLLAYDDPAGGGGDLLLECRVLGDDLADGAAAVAVAAARAPGRVARLLPRAHADGALALLADGAVWLWRPGGALAPAGEGLPPGCATAAAAPAAALAAARGAAAPALGLDAAGRLFWGRGLLATGVTSFALRHAGAGGPLLLATTAAHALWAAPLRHGGMPSIPLAGGSYSPAAREGDLALRAVEEHSRLVAAPAGGLGALYQAPRGNLEAARPRAAVLAALAAALDAGARGAAWALATGDRLDLNVLVDYRWPRFLAEAGDFLLAIGSDVEAADFVAALAPGSVAAPGGEYAAALPPPPGGGGAAPAPEDKVAAAARALGAAAAAAAAAARAPAAWLRTELAAAAAAGDLPAALRRVKAAREAEMAAEASAVAAADDDDDSAAPAVATTCCSAEEGLRHLLVRAPSEEAAYRAALSTHDLELAALVAAGCSARDPAETLAELARFAAVEPPALRAAEIELHLERHEAAIGFLVEAGAAQHGRALELARARGLLRRLAALAGAAAAPALQAAARVALAEELEARGRHEDAAVALLAAGEPERAARAYRLAGAWRPALALAARLGRDTDATSALARRLAADLAASHRHAEAAALTLEYLGDAPAAVALLAAGGEWREAARVAWARGAPGLVEAALAPAAAAAAARLLGQAAEDAARVERYSARLAELRARREGVAAALAAAAAAGEAEGTYGDGYARAPGAGAAAADDNDDARSDAAASLASALSAMSIYAETAGGGGGTASGASAASASTLGGRRARAAGKRAKRAARVRPGGPGEEAGVARRLLALAPPAALLAEAGELSEVLVALGHAGDAALLQRRFGALVAVQQAAAGEVLARPPPGEGLAPGPAARAAAAAGGGEAAVAALEAACAAVPGGELARLAAEGAAAARDSRWKWDALRDA